MKSPPIMRILIVLLFAASCDEDDPVSPEGNLLEGTWGGDNVALIVEADTSHVHIACTYGYFDAPIHADAEGRFSVPGSYVLRAYPIEIGPSLPAQFAGVTDGQRITMTVAVNDTVEKEIVVLGPVSVRYGQDPQMGPCPICDRRLTRR
jgi:hypothetical protein